MIHILTVAAFILPLGLDTFALSAALGALGLARRERLRAGLVLVSFEAVMPFVGFLIGSGIGTAVGKYSDYAAAMVLAAVGLFMLWPKDEENEAGRVALLQRARGAAIIGLGLGISLDELAIGFGGGLLRLPLVVLVLLIASQAAIASFIGMQIGSRLGETARERAEQIAGGLLIAASALILVEKAASH